MLKRMRLNTEANRTMIDRAGPLHLATMMAAPAHEGVGPKSRPVKDRRIAPEKFL